MLGPSVLIMFARREKVRIQAAAVEVGLLAGTLQTHQNGVVPVINAPALPILFF